MFRGENAVYNLRSLLNMQAICPDQTSAQIYQEYSCHVTCPVKPEDTSAKIFNPV